MQQINKIKMIRMQQGLSQLELAKQINVGENFLSKIETGRIAPSQELIRRLATALGVKVKELIAGPDPHHAKTKERKVL